MSVNVDQTTVTVIASLDSNEVSLVEERPTISITNGGDEIVITDMRGTPGVRGDDGEDGLTPQLRSDGTNIQTSTNGINWTNLVPLSALTGAKGTTGDAAKSIKLDASLNTFRFDTSGNPIVQTIQFTAHKQAVSGAPVWTITASNGAVLFTGDASAVVASGYFTSAGPDNIAMSSAAFASLIAGAPERETFSVSASLAGAVDTVTVTKVSDGAPGLKGDKGDRGDDAVIPATVVRSDEPTSAITIGDGTPPKLKLIPNGYGGSYVSQLAAGAGAEGILQLGNNAVNTIVAGNTGVGGALRIVTNNSTDASMGIDGTTAMTFGANGAVNAPVSLSVNGNQVWHAGNFTPGGGGDAMRAGGNTFTGGAQIFAPSATGYASIRIGKGVAPTSPTDGDMWRDSTGALFLRKDTATRSIVTNDGATFAGRVVTAASAAGAAGLNIPAGTAPTSPSAGDLWGTTTGLFYRTASATLSFMPSTGGTFTGKVNLPASTTSAAPLNLGQSSNTPTSPVNGDIWIDDFGFNYQYFGATYQVPIGAPSTFANNTWNGANSYTGASARITLAQISGGVSRFNMASGPSGPTTPAAGDIWNLNNVLKFRKASTTVDVITSDVYDSYYQVSLYLPSCPAVGTDIKVPLVANSLVETSGTLLVGASNAISGTLGFDVRTNFGSNLVMNWTQSGFTSPSVTAGTADTVTASNWIVIRVTAQDAAAGAITLSLRLKRVA